MMMLCTSKESSLSNVMLFSLQLKVVQQKTQVVDVNFLRLTTTQT